MTFEVPGSIWHTDQGKQYDAHQTRQLLLHKGFVLSMSRAGTPTDNGDAERFVGVFKLAVADRRPYHTPGEFLRAAEAWINFYNLERPHEGVDNLSPLQYVQQHGLEDIPSLALW
jgi:putative transposase